MMDKYFPTRRYFKPTPSEDPFDLENCTPHKLHLWKTLKKTQNFKVDDSNFAWYEQQLTYLRLLLTNFAEKYLKLTKVQRPVKVLELRIKL